ncbi:AI-2E family transporter [Jeotgalibacillus sp. R-1-5s-1]|uniref:AI-2E family transporter n=1 Tax=Jeotgalibacillus sp. R-1-5s-1 TaxID=2555897 RepID=UPI00106A2B86|nr:AI-2E family transporter [Jeotgalibacillus sp. R-1-5s-1]TFD92372.1 AI-2E family transporter [Jeotgalibacillus sp. R-1-5s-1]
MIQWVNKRFILKAAGGVLFLWLLFFTEAGLVVRESAVTAVVPLLISAVLAYLLLPAVHFLNKARCPDLLSIWIIFILIICSVISLIQWGIPFLIVEGPSFITSAQTVARELFAAGREMEQLLTVFPEAIQLKAGETVTHVTEQLDSQLSAVFLGLDDSIKWIVILTLVPFMTFYLLKDRRSIKHWVYEWIPGDKKEKMRFFLRESDKSLGGYIRGQVLLSTAIAVLTYVLLLILSVPYAPFLAIIMGIFNVIPYVGPIIGSIPAVLIASTISIPTVLWIVAGVFVIQMLESHLLSPWIIGNSVHFHPIVMMVLLLAGGEIGGVLGLIVIIPFAMLIRLLWKTLRLNKFDHELTKG